MKPTPSQQAAIDARGSNLLVSAAAGSGKTAVLAERIIALIREGAKVDDLLIVTFTRAAAAEMRERIMKALRKGGEAGDAWLAQQSLRVERADISTLHGFCGKICKEHFQAAGIDPMVRVADTAEMGMLRAKAMETALLSCFEEPTSAFAYVAECFSQNALEQSIQTLYTFLMARPDPWSWMDTAMEAYEQSPEALAESCWMECIVNSIAMQADTAHSAYGTLVEFAHETGLYVQYAENEREACKAFADTAFAGYDALMQMDIIAFGRKPRKPKDVDEAQEEHFGALRDKAKKIHKRALDEIDSLRDLLGMAEAMNDSGVAIMGIYQAVQKYHEVLQGEKAERNVLDFSDLEHCALAALQDDAIAQAVREKYAHVFIDEYQDSSLLQEAILQRVVSKDNLFMVGDVKQSIYRFRLAEPTLFLRKMNAFSADAAAIDRKIFLSANFRSRESVLAGINRVFESVFVGGAMELMYDADARLYPGGNMEPGGSKPELHIIAGEKEEEDERAAIAVEAELIAERIIDLRSDPDDPIALRDMVVLLRTVTGKAAAVVDALRAHGISAWSDMEEDALDRIEMQEMVSLLSVVDNMRQDIPLIAALRGPALGLSESDLVAIRVAHPQHAFVDAVTDYALEDNALGHALREFMERLHAWRLEVATLPLDVFIRKIYADTGYYAQIGASPDGALRQSALRMLAEHAGAFQRLQPEGNLAGFLLYLSRVKSRDGLVAMNLGEREDVVRVMSIHKSKGLQFRAVFMAGLGARFRSHEGLHDLQLHSEMGVGLIAVNPMLRTKQKTLAQRAIMEKKRQETLAEEARILYVGMTRAIDRLILIATAKEIEHVPPGSARCMLDWIAPNAQDGAFELYTQDRSALQLSEKLDISMDAVVSSIEEYPADAILPMVSRALSYLPPALVDAPLKQSVSQRVRIAPKEGEAESVRPVMDDLPRRPFFMEERGLTASERGDAVHAFLRCVKLDESNAKRAAKRMVDSGILSNEQAIALPLDRLQALLDSALFQRMRQSPKVQREWPFNLRETVDNTSTLLQGVIDCCFMEDDQWVLVDYKTDRNKNQAELIAKYEPQLSMYAEALVRISGIRVSQKILYLVTQGLAIEV